MFIFTLSSYFVFKTYWTKSMNCKSQGIVLSYEEESDLPGSNVIPRRCPLSIHSSKANSSDAIRTLTVLFQRRLNYSR